jgi:hypothetical protein
MIFLFPTLFLGQFGHYEFPVPDAFDHAVRTSANRAQVVLFLFLFFSLETVG